MQRSFPYPGNIAIYPAEQFLEPQLKEICHACQGGKEIAIVPNDSLGESRNGRVPFRAKILL